MTSPRVDRTMKTKVKHGIHINRPVEEVFKYVSNVDNYPKWQSSLFSVRNKSGVSAGQLVGSSRVQDQRNVLGKEVEAVWSVVNFQPNRSITLEANPDAPVYWQITWSVEAVDGGTFLSGEGGGNMGDMGMSDAEVARGCQHLLEGDFATLRDLLEAKR